MMSMLAQEQIREDLMEYVIKAVSSSRIIR